MTTDALKKKNRRQRLDPRGWIGYLVGYNSTNIYRVWNPLTNKVISTRDVIFNEKETFSGDIQHLRDDLRELMLENPGIPLPFRIQTVSLKVQDLKFKVLDTII
jgi:hypothetical protein